MSDQIDTLYEQFGLDQTALTNSVTLATAGANETITVRDIQINNANGRTLDLKIGGTTILTNTGSTSYGGTEYIGPGQSLTLTYRAGTYPPAAASAPNVYCNKFELFSNLGRHTYYYNNASRIANTVLPWSNTSTYHGMFSREDHEVRGSITVSSWATSLVVPVSNYTKYFIGQTSGDLYFHNGTYDSSATSTAIRPSYNGADRQLSNHAYDGSRYIYALLNQSYASATDGNWGMLAKVDTLSNGSTSLLTLAPDNANLDLWDGYFDFGGNFNQLSTGFHRGDFSRNGQYLDGYYVCQPRSSTPFILVNTTNSTMKSLPFGVRDGFGNYNQGHVYFAKSSAGEYIIGFLVNDYGYSTSAAPYYNCLYWWNIGSDLANPILKNSGLVRERTDDGFKYQDRLMCATRDPNNPSYYYTMTRGSYSTNSNNYTTGTSQHTNAFRIIDFTYGYPVWRNIQNIHGVGFGMRAQSINETFNGYIIPSLTNYTYNAPATPAFGTVDVRVAGIRSSI